MHPLERFHSERCCSGSLRAHLGNRDRQLFRQFVFIWICGHWCIPSRGHFDQLWKLKFTKRSTKISYTHPSQKITGAGNLSTQKERTNKSNVPPVDGEDYLSRRNLQAVSKIVSCIREVPPLDFPNFLFQYFPLCSRVCLQVVQTDVVIQ